MRGVEMERDEGLHARDSRERKRVFEGAVSPPDPRPVLVVGVLRVVDQYVDARRDLESRAPLGLAREVTRRECRLVVGEVRNRARLVLQPVADGRTRVAHERGAYVDVGDVELGVVDVVDVQVAGQLGQADREEWR